MEALIPVASSIDFHILKQDAKKGFGELELLHLTFADPQLQPHRMKELICRREQICRGFESGNPTGQQADFQQFATRVRSS